MKNQTITGVLSDDAKTSDRAKAAVTRSGDHRHESAMFCTSGYSLELRCCMCMGDKYDFSEMSNYQDRTIEAIFFDGPNSYYEARKLARRRGWVLHKDGFATCPRCN